MACACRCWWQAGRRGQAREIMRMRTQMEELLAEHTGQPIEKVTRDIDRDKIMTADEALWAAQRSGLRFTCLSSKLTTGEVEYRMAFIDSGSFDQRAGDGREHRSNDAGMLSPIGRRLAPFL